MESTKKIKISLGQMDVKLGDVATNLMTMRGMTVTAANQNADLVIFPELWSTGYDLLSAAD